MSSRPDPGIGAAAVGLALAGVLQLSWLSEFMSGSTLPTRTSYVSELAVAGQPWSEALRAADAVAGLCILLVAFQLARFILAGDWLARIATISLALLGIGTLIAAMWPMGCAPSVSEACAAAMARGDVELTQMLHASGSAVAGVGAFVGFPTAALAVRQRQRPAGVVALIMAGAYLLAATWELVELAGLGVGAGGWSQRIAITLSASMLVMMALAAATRGWSAAVNGRQAGWTP